MPTAATQKRPRRPAEAQAPAPVNLADLLEARQRAWDLLGAAVRFRDGITADDASKQFREADRAIVESLKTLGHPALISWKGERVYLWLTSDRLNFLVVDGRTRKPVHSDGKHGAAMLYDYPAPERRAWA